MSSLFETVIFCTAISLVPKCGGSLALRDVDIRDGEPIPTIDLGNTSYVVFRKSLPWLEARRICETTIGRLGVFYHEDDGYDVIDAIEAISIPFSETYDRKNFSEEFGMDRRYWFGLTDIGLEGDWTWMDDGRQLTYHSLWYPNQPDHVEKHKLEHCVALWNPIYYLRENHSWNDEPCEHKLYFICEHLPGKKERTIPPPEPPPQKRIIAPETTTTEQATPPTTTTKEPTTTPITTTEEPTTPPATTTEETPTTIPVSTTQEPTTTPTTTTQEPTTTPMTTTQEPTTTTPTTTTQEPTTTTPTTTTQEPTTTPTTTTQEPTTTTPTTTTQEPTTTTPTTTTQEPTTTTPTTTTQEPTTTPTTTTPEPTTVETTTTPTTTLPVTTRRVIESKWAAERYRSQGASYTGTAKAKCKNGKECGKLTLEQLMHAEDEKAKG